MKFISTRGGECVSGARAIVQGIAKDGGLFVPEQFPQVTREELEQMLPQSYAERASFVLSKYLDEYDAEELTRACEQAYSRFEGEDPAPLVKIDAGLYMLELFHGPTCAFKDMALTLLPYLLRKGCDLCGIKETVLILVATSGDTGKAALEGFKDAAGVKIMVFYPDEGVSKMQKLQMATQEGKNVRVVAVRGNFDECQTAVKKIFTSDACKEELLKKGVVLSSANSINFGRLAPQIAYYFSAYLDLVSSGQIDMGAEVNFAVPTGNFGNILAAYYAKRMGLPVGKLICASNKNNVLTDFIRTGVYDKRLLWTSSSPPTSSGSYSSFRAGMPCACRCAWKSWRRTACTSCTTRRKSRSESFCGRISAARTRRSRPSTNFSRNTNTPWIRTPPAPCTRRATTLPSTRRTRRRWSSSPRQARTSSRRT